VRRETSTHFKVTQKPHLRHRLKPPVHERLQKALDVSHYHPNGVTVVPSLYTEVGSLGFSLEAVREMSIEFFELLKEGFVEPTVDHKRPCSWMKSRVGDQDMELSGLRAIIFVNRVDPPLSLDGSVGVEPHQTLHTTLVTKPESNSECCLAIVILEIEVYTGSKQGREPV